MCRLGCDSDTSSSSTVGARRGVGTESMACRTEGQLPVRGEEIECASHDDARHAVDDEVWGAGDDLGVEGVDVVLHG